LEGKVELEKQSGADHNLPVQPDGSFYTLDSIDLNNEQSDLVFSVLKKIKEWTEFPTTKKTNQEAHFEPLRITVIGPGGTGKSFVINVLVTCFKTLFPDLDVTTVVGPTGASAFNVGGQTVHSKFRLSPMNLDADLSSDQEAHLIDEFRRLLLLCVDERSLVSSGLLGAVHGRCLKTAHGGQPTNDFPFGPIPIVLVFGDDHQLPSVTIGNVGKGAIWILDENGNQERSKCCPGETMGQLAFLELAKDVHELVQSHRLDKDPMLKGILEDLRSTGKLSDDQISHLETLHVDNLTPATLEFLTTRATWIFTTRQGKNDHNYKRIAEVHSPTNPVCHLITSKSGTGGSSFNARHWDRKTLDNTGSTYFCRDARVCIRGWNMMASWGLFNGSMATVVQIMYKEGASPNENHLPEYVIVELDSYRGPIWNVDKPNHVPIPMKTMRCKAGCCIMMYCPLELAFARTLHTFQGGEAGHGKPIPAVVVEVGTSQFEANNVGTLYTSISRGSTTGNGNPDRSTIFFSGVNACKKRLQDTFHKKSSFNSEQLLDKVKRRMRWIKKLLAGKRGNHPSAEEKEELQEWAMNFQMDRFELDELIDFHKKA